MKKPLFIYIVDIKGFHGKAGPKIVSGFFVDFLKRGVEIRLVHAKESGLALKISSNSLLTFWKDEKVGEKV